MKTTTPRTAVRVIPCLDIDDGRVVKGVQFQNLRDSGDPAEVARLHTQNGADEIAFLDITATHHRRDTLIDILRQVAAQCFVPLTAGGGVRSAEDMRKLLNAGADKVSVNSAALARPELIEECALRFGAQCVVVAIDARRRPDTPDQWDTLTHGGRRSGGREAVAWARHAAALGAGEILLTSFDRDGTRSGFDIPLLRAVTAAVSVPVIASGGAGGLADLVAAVRDGGASAVLAASIFHDRDTTPLRARRALAAAGLPARPG
ncbi:MAG: imidazole glycerol phosphate synthase subunit HisF [Alphaproteobacteria bacterium]|nr:imidazole glycerol phosphate synthase subunit HisF [Alphaproteobacteria bacterium]